MKEYQPAPNLLKDRIILVTGAGDGIGRTMSLAFAAHGATIILLGKTIPKLESVYDEIEAGGGPEPAIYPMHLEGATPHDYDELANKLTETFGRLDGLLHNAANLPYLSRIKDYAAEDWLRVMQVNLNAPFFLTQACLPLLMNATDASVIFTTDAPGLSGKAHWGAYGVAKAGADNLMQTLADELENTPIRVNSLDPGPTRTALRKRVYPGEDANHLKQPDALNSLYLWLMGPDSANTRGEIIRFEDTRHEITK